jgi:hypothetical protein
MNDGSLRDQEGLTSGWMLAHQEGLRQERIREVDGGETEDTVLT